MVGFSASPLSPAIGAEIRGIDFSKPVDTETVSRVRRALLDHLVLVFRCGEISEDAQISFAEHFGPTVGAF